MPSRFEPCGLNQMYSLRYGTLPIVRATGGLVDTVANYDEATGGGTGFMFDDLHPEALANTIGWALSTWYDRPEHIEAMRRRAMAQDFSWSAPRANTKTCISAPTPAAVDIRSRADRHQPLAYRSWQVAGLGYYGGVRIGAIVLVCLAGLACKRPTPGYCGGEKAAAGAGRRATRGLPAARRS